MFYFFPFLYIKLYIYWTSFFPKILGGNKIDSNEGRPTADDRQAFLGEVIKIFLFYKLYCVWPADLPMKAMLSAWVGRQTILTKKVCLTKKLRK